MSISGLAGGLRITIFIFRAVIIPGRIRTAGKRFRAGLYRTWMFIWSLMIVGPTGVIWSTRIMSMNRLVILWDLG